MQTLRLTAVILALSLITLSACSRPGATSALPSAGSGQDALRPLASANYSTLYSFRGQPDGATPNADLITVHGALYGTTAGGGVSNLGTAFQLTPGGSEKVLYNFTSAKSNSIPNEGLTALHGEFFGTTSFSVFAVNAAGTERLLHSFAGGADGYDGLGPLARVGNNLYGITELGGLNACNSGCGTVFEVTPSGSYRVIYKFKGRNDGFTPTGSVIAVKGVLYGTTSYGGKNNAGTVFRMTTSGNKEVLYNFTGYDDGSHPYGLPLESRGVLYVSAPYGAIQGAIVAVTLSGKASILHTFKGKDDGASPNGGLVELNGVIYGTSQTGGPQDRGTIFSVTKAGSEHVLYDFHGGNDGNTPLAGLVNVNGTLYGTTFHGGNADKGTVFKIRP
jgi:uncharacterized repeat protein (TIGR03803 family)